MTGFWSITWGDIASVVGILVSLGGFLWAIKAASGARTASNEAKKAATETRNSVARHLQAVDLQRAIGLIGRIKVLHDNERWEASAELYQTIREMLSDIIVRCPKGQAEIREKLATAKTHVRYMEDFVRSRANETVPDRQRSRFIQGLNEIQSDLEELASGMGFVDSQGEAR